MGLVSQQLQTNCHTIGDPISPFTDMQDPTSTAHNPNGWVEEKYGWWFRSAVLTSWGKGSLSHFTYKVLTPSQVVGNGISEPSNSISQKICKVDQKTTTTNTKKNGSPADQTKWLVFRMIHVKDSLLPEGKVWWAWTSWENKPDCCQLSIDTFPKTNNSHLKIGPS